MNVKYKDMQILQLAVNFDSRRYSSCTVEVCPYQRWISY